ncbi:hypothetical protein F5Y18DRAFT_399849, partial [Xylariaceae sp. FL1019]
MYLLSVAALFLSAVIAQSTLYFTCNSTQANGFSPKCCTDINGQVGVNCITAHQMGATDPLWSCNLFVYNISGCCQPTGWKNPDTNFTLDLCATSI